MSSSLRKIMPMRDTVAGDANRRSCVSKRKLTLSPKAMRSPLGSVRRWLSSSTELSDSIHSGSTSPSQTIHDRTSGGSRTTARAASVRTPSLHSRVSRSISPRSCCRGIDLGFMTCVFTVVPHFASAAWSTRQTVDLPQPLGPTTTQPMRWSSASLSWSIFRTWASSTVRRNASLAITSRIATSSAPPATSPDATPGKTSPMSARNRAVSPKVSFESVFTRTALMSSSPSAAGGRPPPAPRASSTSLPPVLSTALSARRPQS
mmetsp:Transcript_5207/g.17719  ORF Transcript_5207/g.17719 Transcript_5207/m.17719 type:complete len:262 (-) Transcript_5207:373-1158(-)